MFYRHPVEYQHVNRLSFSVSDQVNAYLQNGDVIMTEIVMMVAMKLIAVSNEYH